MKYHKIDIDDEVYGFIKQKAEPFVDTPNSVLRRLLLHSDGNTAPSAPRRMSSENHEVQKFSADVPAALQETLAVARLVINGTPRPSATNRVANSLGIAPQTVLDKYCRQLGLKAYEFDRLLEQPGRADLISLLRKRFPTHEDIIKKYLSG